MSDPFHAGFWEGAGAGELRVQRCAACGARQLPGRPFCLACAGDDVHWVPATGSGVLVTSTVVHAQVLEHLVPPYAVGLVALEEGPRLMTFVADGVAIGDPVVVGFRERPDGPPLPEARRA